MNKKDFETLMRGLQDALAYAKAHGREKADPSSTPDLEERHRRTFEGLADVDAGRTIPHSAVRIWAKGLGKGKRVRRS